MNNNRLKFRIWDKEEKKWLENGMGTHCFSEWAICPFTGEIADYVGFFSGDIDHRSKTTYKNFWVDKTNFKEWKKVDEPRFLVQQFTGLLDENRIEIYEGDIVKRNNTKYIYVVDFNEKSAGYAMKDMDGDFFPLWYYSGEVIGNICEHKELLDNQAKSK